jgi:hypothetical protein
MVKQSKLSDNDQILLYECIMQVEFLNTEIKNTESKISHQASKNESKAYSNYGFSQMNYTSKGRFETLLSGGQHLKQNLE